MSQKYSVERRSNDTITIQKPKTAWQLQQTAHEGSRRNLAMSQHIKKKPQVAFPFSGQLESCKAEAPLPMNEHLVCRVICFGKRRSSKAMRRFSTGTILRGLMKSDDSPCLSATLGLDTKVTLPMHRQVGRADMKLQGRDCHCCVV